VPKFASFGDEFRRDGRMNVPIFGSSGRDGTLEAAFEVASARDGTREVTFSDTFRGDE
jgi:hypothetical protein